MLILLPPSEGKAPAVRGKPLNLDSLSFPSLTQPRQQVLTALTDLCRDPELASKILKVGPGLAAEVARNRDLFQQPTQPVAKLYTGVLYDALDLSSLTGSDRARATRALVVVSACFGMLKLNDRVPAYRLSGAVDLPTVGPLAAFWRQHLTSQLAEAGDQLVIDLRSQTYLSFAKVPVNDPKQLATVKVWQQVGDKRTVVSHFNKATKGKLVRDLLTTASAPRSRAELATLWRDLGWHVENRADTPELNVVVAEVH